MPPIDYWQKLTCAPLFGDVSDYWRIDIAGLERALMTRPESYWMRQGERRAMREFASAAERVPAYKDFLRRHRVDPRTIKSVRDFEQVPFTDKTNYVNRYPLASRCWDGRLTDASLIAVSSGTSGEPKFWPRQGRQEMEAAIIHELAYRSLFDVHRRRTLAVIGFPMGVYVSGVATLLPTWMAGQRDYQLTTVSVGNHKEQAIRVIRELGRDYQQVLIIGHPFFVKDLIETGRRSGIAWKALNVRMLFCSEGFSEQWRSYLNRKAGLPSGAVASFNTYGSSEMLLMGHETPLSVTVRRAMKRSPTPNLFQYNPLLRFIQTHENELLFTADSGIPLIRFNLHDAGSLLSLDDAMATIRGRARPRKYWKLPFVALDGRSDHTLVFYAANIYPEHVHAALNAPRFLKDITGKFTMLKGYDQRQEAYLELNVELQPDVKIKRQLSASLAKHVTKELRRINMEYNFLWEHLGKDLTPRIVLRPYQDPSYFRPGLKPKYILKE